MNTLKNTRLSGFALMEILVTILVVAVGIFGLAKMNALSLASTGLSKTRAEATQLAQEKLEELRNNVIRTAFDALDSNSDNVTGVTETFRRSWLVTNLNNPAMRKRIQVCVSWGSSANDACSAPAANKVEMTSIVSWYDYGVAGYLGTTGGGAAAQPLPTPKGRARVGGDTTYNPASLPAGTELGTSHDGVGSDNTRIYVNPDGKRELIDKATGRVLLTVNDGSNFSTIAGNVYVEWGVSIGGADRTNLTPAVIKQSLMLIPSDASVCRLVFGVADNVHLPVYPVGATGNAIKYSRFQYRCYVGGEWWGNIGVVRLDNVNQNDRVCIGDPEVPQTVLTPVNTKRPRLSTVRSYRGFVDLGNGQVGTTGIGIDVGANNNRNYTDRAYQKQDFLLTRITGNPTDGNCKAKLELVNVNDPFDGNPGRYVCLSQFCPNSLNPDGLPSTIIHGTVNHLSAQLLNGIANNQACASSSWTHIAGNQYSYSCTINWHGFAGGSWNGSVEFTRPTGSTASLCATGATTTVTPATLSVAYTVNDVNATPSNALYFTDVPREVTAINVNFDVTNGPCGLGTPLTRFDPPLTHNQRALAWDAITGATQYRVYSCPSASCNTWTLASTQTTTRYSISVNNNETLCLSVIARNAPLNSQPSAPKCVSRSGGTYSSVPWTGTTLPTP